jgi:hypothetical protein
VDMIATRTTTDVAVVTTVNPRPGQRYWWGAVSLPYFQPFNGKKSDGVAVVTGASAMTFKLFRLVIFAGALIVTGLVSAQNPSSAAESSSQPSKTDSTFQGFNSYASLSGIVTGTGSLMKLDSSVGYDFNRNFGVFVGMPLYLSNAYGDASTPSGHIAGLGDAYIGAEFYAFPKLFRYNTSVTVGLPTGSVVKGFSPGSVTADWTNTFRRSFGKVTPRVSVGMANTVGVAVGIIPTSQFVDNSIASKGTFVHVEEGADFDLSKRTYAGGEGYHILPFSTHSADINTDGITPDNGIDAWFGFLPHPYVSTELGYSRSMTFALNTLSFRVGLNVGKIVSRYRVNR